MSPTTRSNEHLHDPDPSHDDIEARLRSMFRDATGSVEERPDLFARVALSLEQQRERRRFRSRVAAIVLAAAMVLAAVIVATTDFSNHPYAHDSRWHMHWWILELLTTLVLCGIAVGLGPLIKRFGKAYAADVFRANPRTGKSYIVLTDFAYYLVFGAYILFTTTFELPNDWLASSIAAAQIKHEVARVGGILLIIGALHSANIVLLPVIGRLFTLNRQLDDDEGGPRSDRTSATTATTAATAPAPSVHGTVVHAQGAAWIIRIEPISNEMLSNEMLSSEAFGEEHPSAGGA